MTWDRQQGMPRTGMFIPPQGMAMQQPQHEQMQPTQAASWQAGWQGELGPNLIPMAAGPGMQQMNGSQNIQNMALQEMPGASIQPIMGNLQNMHVGQDMPGMHMNVQTMQIPPVQNMNNMQSQMMQVITLPAGAPPPEGAIPMGPMHSLEQEPASPQMIQMIAVPVGEEPPDGAIPVDQFSAASTAASTPPQSECGSPQRRTFKITDPRTGREVRGKGDETVGAPRRLRIINPKTGEEVGL